MGIHVAVDRIGRGKHSTALVTRVRVGLLRSVGPYNYMEGPGMAVVQTSTASAERCQCCG
ncbi:MAG: hypothetical protein GY937_28695 [bacterium]|nr:hypothetical protein [bacterium]